MSADKLNTMFENLKDGFDIEEPKAGHEQRFLQKLTAETKVVQLELRKSNPWKPILSIAASIVLIMTLAFGIQNNQSPKGLASVSPEMETTEDFFTSTINSELEKLNNEESPEYQDLVVDALFQLKILEQDYEKLITDLNDSGDDKRVIHAMITNFQNRILILENVSEQIDELKQTKNITNENSTTL
jgi:hypothetical protein